MSILSSTLFYLDPPITIISHTSTATSLLVSLLTNSFSYQNSAYSFIFPGSHVGKHNFALISDSQNGSLTFHRLLERIMNRRPEALFHLGDKVQVFSFSSRLLTCGRITGTKTNGLTTGCTHWQPLRTATGMVL